MQKGRRRASGFAIAAAATCGIVLVAWRVANAARSENSQTPAREVAVARNGIRDALMNRDALAVADNYADLSTVWTHGGAVIDGARAIETSMRSAFENGTFANVAIETDRRAYLGVVFESGTYAYTFAKQPRGEVRFAGRFVALWKREGTRWKIVFEAAQPVEA